MDIKEINLLFSEVVFTKILDYISDEELESINDSLKSINMPLNKFGERFKLDVSKDIMPYPIYTQENINKVYVPIFSTLPYVKPTDEKTILR